jgi:hypothetical protein
MKPRQPVRLVVCCKQDVVPVVAAGACARNAHAREPDAGGAESILVSNANRAGPEVPLATGAERR